jgi:2-oxoglutarate ferredoxin oxidoreductase subunit alpha
MSDLPEITPRFAKDASGYKPFARDEEILSREWAIPGMKGFEHRIGGLEKNETGTVSHNPENHQKNSEIRENKVERVNNMVPSLEAVGDESGDILVVGWGGTYGHLINTVKELRAEGKNVSLAHFNYIKPLPANTREIFSRFKKIIVCELNLGQFAGYLRDKMPGFEYHQYNKLKGLPFTVKELKESVVKLLED